MSTVRQLHRLGSSLVAASTTGNSSVTEDPEYVVLSFDQARHHLRSQSQVNLSETADCYGEAFWVGETDVDELMRPGVVSGVRGRQEDVRLNDDDQEDTWGLPVPDLLKLAGRAGHKPTVVGVSKSSDNKRAPGRPPLCTPSLPALTPSPVFPLPARRDEEEGEDSGYSGGEPSNKLKSCKMLQCDKCSKHYRNLYSLEHHICVPKKEKNLRSADIPTDYIDGVLYYFCPTCNKPFKWLGNLTRHNYVHTGQRFFKCELCNKEFFSAYQVRRHMNSHLGVRYKCEVCDKPFTCKYACAWHTKQHYNYAE